jgi:hypothetical protein
MATVGDIEREVNYRMVELPPVGHVGTQDELLLGPAGVFITASASLRDAGVATSYSDGELASGAV